MINVTIQWPFLSQAYVRVASSPGLSEISDRCESDCLSHGNIPVAIFNPKQPLRKGFRMYF